MNKYEVPNLNKNKTILEIKDRLNEVNFIILELSDTRPGEWNEIYRIRIDGFKQERKEIEELLKEVM